MISGDRLKNFHIHVGKSLDLTQNRKCGDQGDAAMGDRKEFPCIGGAVTGRYLTVHRNDSVAENTELVLFEVVAIGGNFRLVQIWGLSVVPPGT